jgi:hypothetical protein
MVERKEKPLTREDVLRLIKGNGRTAKELDLSNHRFVEPIDLSGIKFITTHLFRANFNASNLNRGIMKDKEGKLIKNW